MFPDHTGRVGLLLIQPPPPSWPCSHFPSSLPQFSCLFRTNFTWACPQVFSLIPPICSSLPLPIPAFSLFLFPSSWLTCGLFLHFLLLTFRLRFFSCRPDRTGQCPHHCPCQPVFVAFSAKPWQARAGTEKRPWRGLLSFTLAPVQLITSVYLHTVQKKKSPVRVGTINSLFFPLSHTRTHTCKQFL